jgi:hypothetical protein
MPINTRAALIIVQFAGLKPDECRATQEVVHVASDSLGEN